MSTIVNKIKNSVESITGLPCYYDDSGRLNVKLDYLEYPLAFFTLINDGSLNIMNANYREVVDVAIFFIKPTTFDFESIENEAIIEECKGYALKWLNGLRLQGELMPEFVLNTTRVYNYGDTILTGYAINIRLQELIGETCLAPLVNYDKVIVEVKPVDNAGTITGAGKYAKNTQATLIAEETNSQYRFNNWTDKDDTVLSSSDTYTFTVNGDITINANFLINPHFTSTILPDSSYGSVLINSEDWGEGYYKPNTQISVEGLMDEKAYFINWTDDNGDIVSSNNPYTFTITEDTHLNANYGDCYHITITDSPYGEVDYDEYVIPGNNTTIEAIPNSGYAFIEWQVNSLTVSTDNPYTFIPVSDVEITPIYAPAYTITTQVNPNNSGTISGGGNIVSGETCTLTATPDNAYIFSEWQDNQGTTLSTSNPYSFTVNNDATIIGVFTPKYNITTIVNPSNAGTISGSGLVVPGDSCTLTANPSSNYAFSEWQVNGTTLSTNNPYTFTPNSDMTITGIFVETRSINITVSPSGYGTVEGGGDLPVGSTATITATPASGKKFKQWEID
jgi:hypothetical protein